MYLFGAVMPEKKGNAAAIIVVVVVASPPFGHSVKVAKNFVWKKTSGRHTIHSQESERTVTLKVVTV